MIIPMIRTIILYILVVCSMRVMGKRQIGEMQPSELAVAIMISDLASIPMQEVDIPLISGVVPVLTLLVIEVLMSFICLKNATFRKIMTGEPSIIVYNGKILEKEMKKLRFNLSDLLEQLRINGCTALGDVQIAVLETTGQLSIVKKSDANPVTVGDLQLKNIPQSELPCMVIVDGEINESELTRSGKSLNWLRSELEKRNQKACDLFYAELYSNGDILFQIKEKKK